MPNHTRHTTLRFKAMSAALLVILVALGIMGTTSVLRMNATLAQEHERSVNAMATSLAHACELPLLVEDRAELERLFDPYEDDANVLFCAAFDASGEIIASVSPDAAAWSDFLEYRSSRGKYQLSWQDVVRSAEQSEFDVFGTEDTASDEPALIGSVALGFSMEPMRLAQRDQAQTTLLAGTVTAFMTLVLAWIVVGRWTKRLGRLVEAASSVSRGDYTFEVNDVGADEIGQLGASFDDMRLTIRDRNRELEAFNDTLQQQVTERTRDLESAKQSAEAASQAKSDFLANMSHEIRTPMTSILGYSEQLLDPTISPSIRLDAINTIHRNGQSLLSIINDILDISKIEAGQMSVEPVDCSPRQVIADVMSLMHVRAHAKHLSLTAEFDGLIPETITTDTLRLRQIIVNLVGNAIKFTETGGVSIVTRYVEPDTNSKAMLEVDVIDTGIGLDDDQCERIFKPFTQADSTMSRRFGGTGLGLTISRRLAEMLGGSIHVESIPGQGSRFRVRIATGTDANVRLIDATSVEEPTPHPAGSTSQPDAAARADGARILLAEDGPDNQRLLSFILTKAGAEVIVAENGRIAMEEALQAAAQDRPFDVILMDMQMPEMDGYTATSLLRERGYRGPIIALTAHAMTGDRERCLNAGCDDYATKPVNRVNLIRMVASWMERSAGEAAA